MASIDTIPEWAARVIADLRRQVADLEIRVIRLEQERKHDGRDRLPTGIDASGTEPLA